jgi:hypothetical protein
MGCVDETLILVHALDVLFAIQARILGLCLPSCFEDVNDFESWAVQTWIPMIIREGLLLSHGGSCIGIRRKKLAIRC